MSTKHRLIVQPTPTPDSAMIASNVKQPPLPFSPLSGEPQSSGSESNATTELPEILCKRYKIERLLGVGGMGAVYRARDLLREQYGDPDPYVAIKTLNEEFAEYPDANALLYTEFALTSRLRHSNVIRLYAFDVDPRANAPLLPWSRSRGRHWISFWKVTLTGCPGRNIATSPCR